MVETAYVKKSDSPLISSSKNPLKAGLTTDLFNADDERVDRLSAFFDIDVDIRAELLIDII